MRKYLAVRLGVAAVQLAAVVAFLLLWEWLSNTDRINVAYFSKPSAVWDQLQTWFSDGSIWEHLRQTMRIFLIGYLIGTLSGIALGVLIGTVTIVREVAEPFLAFFNAVPRLVLLPLFVVWFGFGDQPKILLVVTVILVMVTTNVAAGIREVPRELVDNARLMGASKAGLLREVYIPSIVLWITSTARVTVGYAFNATIAAEFIGASVGIGYLIFFGQASFQAQQIYAGLAMAVVIAAIVDTLLRLLEKRATRWMPSS